MVYSVNLDIQIQFLLIYLIKFSEQDATQIKAVLKFNFSEKEFVFQNWKKCIEYRLKELMSCKDVNIYNIISSWPAYKQSFGYDLVNTFFTLIKKVIENNRFVAYFQISIDFDGMYPGKSNNFFLNWSKLNEILPTYLNMNLKDAKLKSIWVEALEKWTTLDQSNIFYNKSK